MPKNRPLETSHVESIETAWHEHDEVQMLKNLVAKYARVLDMTDSGRDIKPLATGMLEAMDRLKAIDGGEAEMDEFSEILDEL